ncbi:thioredoxin-disulfide reductase [Pichia californica]|uniref:Thioredoxin reductase n=1 Tax=Pichia californica TaxID=460514 RepID=A0A9P6WNV5_9ASCO|nr:thioredoxin-disulfide reductase [[Candida] californica]KAG0690386.1 thioredoxin-disulfide reductase [[Candida] californica]
MVHNKVTIIGSGPAAHTAAIYLARAEMNPVLYEGMMANGIAPGGQLTTTTEIENFPGFPDSLTGSELMDRMKQQSEKFGTKVITETISKVDFSSKPFKLWPEFYEDDEPITTDAVVIATGASAKRLGLKGEETYWQQGISACAVCDGAVPIFRNNPLAVIGGGDSACEEALFLTKFGSKVFMIVRKDYLRASTIMQKRVENNPKLEILYNTVSLEAKGDGKFLTHLQIKNTKTDEIKDLPVNGLFYAIGHTPATQVFKGQLETDETGYIITKPGTASTSVPGVFAAGDVQDSKYRQAITSAGTGCMAALEAEHYVATLDV